MSSSDNMAGAQGLFTGITESNSNLFLVQPEEVARRWQEGPCLRSQIFSHFAEYVPRIYCTDEDARKQDDEQVQHSLLAPIEWFLFGEEPAKGLEKLQQSGSCSQICGRVFRSGETTYSCRDCALDPTCVLCMNCFQNSIHKSHRYKMNTSCGGGYCDCGDIEAWKMGPVCENHESGGAESNPQCELEDGLSERCRMLFSILLHYAVDMMVWQREEQELCLELQPRQKNDLYYCILFNDEHHSFSQVNYTLKKALNCSTEEAQVHSILIDKEGRKSVKYSSKKTCQETQEAISKISNEISGWSLQTAVLHSSLVAHQTFALRLSSWFTNIIGFHSGFRQIFCQVAVEEPSPEEPCCLTRLMLWDSKLFKGARKTFHELMVSSFLLETECKKLFAVEFTKLYKQLQKDFIEDDHEPHISVISLAVQIFTVPTVARYLLEEQNVITVMVECLLEMFSKYLDKNKFHFLNHNTDKLSRAQFPIQDLRYILISKPTDWTEKLRTAFLDGFRAFLSLLMCMQGMEEVKRQFGQHVEEEPHWESAFSLQLQLKYILTMFQEWCASDEEVLLKAYMMCHSAVMEYGKEAHLKDSVVLYLAGHLLNSRPYMVSVEPVSIHLPLTRLLAGLHAQLSRTGAISKLCNYFTEEDLNVDLLIEYPLRCLVLVAQVAAEMWKRNGLSLVSQVYFYRDVKWRQEMYDKDIIMLQIGASRMDPNLFLMLILRRFELFELFKKPFLHKDKDVKKQLSRMAEEMLHLLIIIVGERYNIGVSHVTKDDIIMREIIHLLCIEPMSHSELTKALPEDENHETGLEKVIQKVATFRKPVGSSCGVYEVKKESLKEFNPFFYHYSKSQQTKAEEVQKKIRKAEHDSEAFPPPVPPKFCPAFSDIVKILNCDVMIHIIKTILRKTVRMRETLWNEAIIQRILHLISLALLEEKQQLENEPEEEVSFDFYQKATKIENIGGERISILSLLDKLKQNFHFQTQIDMIMWTLKIFDSLRLLRERSVGASAVVLNPEVPKAEENAHDKEKAERKRKAEAAKLHREKIMAQMSAMQKNFIEKHKLLYEDRAEMQEVGESDVDKESSIEMVVDDTRIGVGPEQGTSMLKKEILTCILCQEEQEVKINKPAMVLTACIQRSTVLTQNKGKVLPKTENFNPLFMNADLSWGTHTGSCGHVMHAACWQKYFEAVQSSSHNRFHAEVVFDLENGEYLCPLCKCLCNTVIPLVPVQYQKMDKENADIIAQMLSFSRWQEIVLARISGLRAFNSKERDDAQMPPTGMAVVSSDFRSVLNFGVQPFTVYSTSIQEMLTVFATAAYRVGLEIVPNEADPRVPVMGWSTCAFTIQCIESLLEYEGKSLFGSLQNRQHGNLKALVQFATAQRVTAMQDVIQKHLTNLLPVLLPNMYSEETPSILDIDLFHVLVSVVCAFPSIYSEGSMNLQPTALSSTYNELFIFHLVTMAHIVQILLTAAKDCPALMEECEESEESHLASCLYNKLVQHTNRCLNSNVSGWYLWEHVKKGITPYLRCAALFFYFLHGVSAPEVLHSASSEGHFEALCSYLALPTNLFLLFKKYQECVNILLYRWCSNLRLADMQKEEQTVLRYPRKINKLVELPEEYSCLLNQTCHFRCPKSLDDDQKHPVLCLICGAILCSQNTCCQETVDGEELGACTIHAIHCAAGFGIFLRIRDCDVILMAGRNRGCLYSAPYVDEYGETDPGLKRGNPLHLSHEHYKQLNLLWQQHGITAEVSRNQDVNSLFILDWQHM
ncbi:E3 ubiquitin-protein ligase UBR1 [Protopterus annectens]|uniref:E3 ubiquitin-protein ligase UBR1 n=1 Tax=Protopterus annectens TaxID=7888 RepID=UPI001CFBA48F|nr:E3 ubiquitin-protein ligase UBR1 [Protopterus annectens]